MRSSARRSRPLSLALGELELDATIAGIGLVRLLGIDRLEFTESGGNQVLRRHAPAHQVLDDRYGPPRGKIPVVLELRIIDRADIRVSVDPKHPGNLAGNFLLQFEQRARKHV